MTKQLAAVIVKTMTGRRALIRTYEKIKKCIDYWPKQKLIDLLNMLGKQKCIWQSRKHFFHKNIQQFLLLPAQKHQKKINKSTKNEQQRNQSGIRFDA